MTRIAGLFLILPGLAFLGRLELVVIVALLCGALLLRTRFWGRVLFDLLPFTVLFALLLGAGLLLRLADAADEPFVPAAAAFRFLVASLSGALGLRTVSARDALAVLQWLRLPPRLLILIVLGIRMFPTVMEAARRRKEVLVARGAVLRWRLGTLGLSLRNAVRLLIPLLLDVVQFGVTMGTLLRLRGFSVERRMTRIPLGPLRLQDLFVWLLLGGLMAALAFWWDPVQL
jgi:energy-coupling factor transporter transmembrane protein EcfT